MNKKIIISSGGSGGHIFPAINLAKHLLSKGYKVILITDSRGYSFLKDHKKLKIYIINTDTPIKKNIFKIIISFFKIFSSIIKSFFILQKQKPSIVIGFGGYVSFPITFSSRFFNCPLIIYESNLIIGRANKFLLSLAKKIMVPESIPTNIPKKYKYKISKTGPILNKKIISYLPKKTNKKNFFSILILGGSQGAEIFGKIIPEAIKILKTKGHNIKVYQQCLNHQMSQISKFYKKNKIKNNIFEFEKNILNLISKTDLAISRCGATTTAELVQTCTPFVAIPYPHAMDNHQYLNAKYYQDKNYCWLLKEKNLSSESLFNLLIKIIKDKKKIKNIREKMKKNNDNGVYKNIEDIIKKVIKNEN